MARISGVDIPREKRLEISLTYIFGIGKPTAQRMCADLDISPNTRVRDLTDEEVNKLRGWVDKNITVEEINALAKEFLKEDTRVSVTIIPKAPSEAPAPAQ